MIRLISYLFAALSLILISLSGVENVHAQEAQTGGQRSLLPEIDPQDIEIRSQFQARFPGLRRQPILGFNPRPRVYQIDPNRRPFIEDEETVMANLPIGVLERPEAPVFNPLGYAEPKNGFARFGLGSFLTPEADVYAMSRLGTNHWVSGNFNYVSTDGHIDEFRSSARDVSMDLIAISSLSDKVKLKATLEALSGFNYFPGLISELGVPVVQNSRVENSGINGGASLTYARTSLSGMALSINGYSGSMNMTSDLVPLTGEATEWGVNANAEYSRLGEHVQEVHRLRVRADAGGINERLGATQNWVIAGASAHYERLFNYQTDVKASAGITVADDGINDLSVYLTPDVTLRHTLFRGLDLRGRLLGRVDQPTLAGVHDENPFFDLASLLQHQYEMRLQAEVLAEPLKGTKFSGGLSYQNIRHYLYYTRNENSIAGTDFTEQYYSPAFRRANIIKLYGSLTQDLKPGIVWLTGEAHWQRPRLSGNEKIPFIESLGAQATVSIRPAGQILIEGWAEFAGDREDSAGNDLSSFFIVGSRFEISVTEKLGVYGKLLNLLSEEYELWRGYPERGFQGFAGITYLF
ncbi:hypothetical protein [Rhodohalobacter mucosus]|uniref:TonB dependent receptor n=1 Tax=Rhodohalobacter mucosus TaxID=2079485 RepID=A0A316TYN7_9BACT|nr:hypothetical protein [Rhodohalobacter mucosus]PWN07924.1 hypothetical protein DDZ15_02625 [Rhodohalobacter mucosus]